MTRIYGEDLVAGDGSMEVRCGNVMIHARCTTIQQTDDGTHLSGTVSVGPDKVLGRDIHIFTTDNEHAIVTIAKR